MPSATQPVEPVRSTESCMIAVGRRFGTKSRSATPTAQRKRWAVLRLASSPNSWRALEPTPENQADVARAFEEAVVDTLAIKCQRALQATGLNRLVVAGGVGANRRLRERLRALAAERGGRVYYPRLEFCTDNGAMIAYAGWRRLAAGQREDPAIEVLPRWPLADLAPAPG